MQTAENDERALRAVPGSQLVRPARERQVYGDTDDLRWRVAGRRALQKTLVPILNVPLRRGSPRNTGQRQGGSQDVLTVARSWVLRIKRIQQQSREGLHRS